MRRSWGFVLGGCLAVAVVGTAGAATLPFTGELTVGIGILPTLVVPGDGTATVNGSGGGLHLSSLALAGGTFGPVSASLIPQFAEIQSIRFTSVVNTGGSFSFPAGGPMGINGLAKLCIFSQDCGSSITVPFGGGIGIGGTQTVAGLVNLTLQHNPWVTGFAPITIHNGDTSVQTGATIGIPAGFQHGPASGTSSTAQASGVVQLVTVTHAFTSLTAAFPEFPVFAVLTLHFVPEPGTLLLVGSGVAGLVLISRRRRRGSPPG
jgi:hypothetical protein